MHRIAVDATMPVDLANTVMKVTAIAVMFQISSAMDSMSMGRWIPKTAVAAAFNAQKASIAITSPVHLSFMVPIIPTVETTSWMFIRTLHIVVAASTIVMKVRNAVMAVAAPPI